jgi:prolyl-tRNA synthetase
MRMSKLFGVTLRDAPAEAEVTSHRYLLRAGFIRQLAAGVFSYLPLARRALTKIENILRQEIDAIGGQEITMPVVHPASLWQESGRWYKVGSEMGRFKDRTGREMVLAMTHEEVVADLVRRDIHSYRQLPAVIYHIQTKWRDDPRPRAGLIRVREFTMKDSYSLDADWEGLERQYRAHYQAYFNIFYRCDLPVVAIKSDVGMMGGKLAHEFIYSTPIGEDSILSCESCGYAANQQIARFTKTPSSQESPQPLEKVATPEAKTIAALADFLGVPKSKTAKAVFMMASIPQGNEVQVKFVFAIVRGDMEVNETKLANAVNAMDLRPATEEEIQAVGAVPGYASPVGLKDSLVVVDELIPESPNLVAGANEAGFHLVNVNYGRDFQAQLIADITLAEADYPCPQCSHTMRLFRGIEVGNIFQLGTHYSEALGCTFLDRDGFSRPVVMGSYGIGSGRLLASIAEAHNDEYGLIWPITVAPYQIHLVVLPSKDDENVLLTADQVYDRLTSSGIEVLYDDRRESPGIKFNDADLIGLPIRLTVSGRSLKNGGLEIKLRSKPDKDIIPLEEVIDRVKETISTLEAEIAANLSQVPYTD